MNKLQEKQLERAKQYAIDKGGLCLSNEYKRAKDYFEWKCKNPKHKSWNAVYCNVLGGAWCPECGFENAAKSKIKKNGLELAIEHSKSKGGECLSTE